MPLFDYNTTIAFMAAAHNRALFRSSLLLTKTAVLSIIVMLRTSVTTLARPMLPAHSLVYFPPAATLLRPSDRIPAETTVSATCYDPYFGMTPFEL
jgi:hypothetical protein